MKLLKYLAALLITAACLYFAFRGVDFEKAFSYRGVLKVFPLAVFCLLCLAVMWVRAWRWKYFYQSRHGATVNGLAISNIIGFMTNNILPLRIGEMVRALMARRKVRAPLSYILATLFIERMFDTMCLLVCLILPLFFSQSFPAFIRKIGLIMAFVLAGLILLLLILRSKPHLAQAIALPLGRKFLRAHLHEKLEHFLNTFTEGLTILRNGPVMWKITLLSLFHWWLVAYSYSLAFRGFSFDFLPWTAPYLTLGLVGLGVALPSAPAFVGPLHAAIIYALSDGYGVPRNTAIGFAVIMHLLMMAPITIAGLFLMWREGLTLSQIRRKADHLEEENNLAEAPVEG